MLDPSSSPQLTNRICGWSALGKLSPAPRRKLVHLRRQAGRYACLVRNRRAAQHQGVPHAGSAPCCGFLELCNAEVGSTPTSKPATATIPLRVLIIAISQGMDTLCVIGPVLPLESCDGNHVFSLMAITFSRFCRRRRSARRRRGRSNRSARPRLSRFYEYTPYFILLNHV
jgi:hypothetical protein